MFKRFSLEGRVVCVCVRVCVCVCMFTIHLAALARNKE